MKLKEEQDLPKRKGRKKITENFNQLIVYTKYLIYNQFHIIIIGKTS